MIDIYSGYLKILGKAFCYEPLCIMCRVEILHWLIIDHENMLLDDTWILSGTQSGMAKHNSDMKACLVYIKIFELYFVLASAGKAL